jgi:hypothetical protein
MIEIYNRATGEMVSVESWKTATPHFAITRPFPSTDPDIDVSDLFNVTHVRSTAIALGPFHDKRIASLCASIMGHLPVPWDDFTMAVSEQFSRPDPIQAARFKKAWTALPKEILAWRKSVADGCMMGDL